MENSYRVYPSEGREETVWGACLSYGEPPSPHAELGHSPGRQFPSEADIEQRQAPTSRSEERYAPHGRGASSGGNTSADSAWFLCSQVGRRHVPPDRLRVVAGTPGSQDTRDSRVTERHRYFASIHNPPARRLAGMRSASLIDSGGNICLRHRCLAFRSGREPGQEHGSGCTLEAEGAGVLAMKIMEPQESLDHDRDLSGVGTAKRVPQPIQGRSFSGGWVYG
jgi:hypothetical protein